jgi:hypothetical protein
MKRGEESNKVTELVDAWLAGEHTMFDACDEEPEIAWQAVLELARRPLTDEQEELLAAGPLETLLSMHGATFIDCVVEEAERNPRLNHLLGGVWRREMPEEIWNRIVNVRKEVW